MKRIIFINGSIAGLLTICTMLAGIILSNGEGMGCEFNGSSQHIGQTARPVFRSRGSFEDAR